MKEKTNKKMSILDLGGIAKSRKVGKGKEREYTKKKVAKKIAKVGLEQFRGKGVFE